MNVVIIGTGYVGLPTGLGFVELGHDVVCVDIDNNKVDCLNNGKITLYEEGLEDLLLKHLQSKKIFFSTSYGCIKNADVVIIAVGTPQQENSGKANLSYIYDVAKQISNHLDDKYKLIAIKSTVPVGTSDEVEKIISNQNVDIISLPEFLREGYALYDFFNPDRIIVGSNSDKANELIKKLYSSFCDEKLIFVNRRSSELIKYASNSFLAMKIHFINEMADLCEKTGADIKDVALGIGLDSRIGHKFLNPGPGFGGSCFPKDTLALQSIAESYNVELSLLNATINGNQKRFKDIANRILEFVKDIDYPTIAIYGLAFKNGTDDCRQSPSIGIIKHILNKRNLKIKAYDLKALDNAKEILGDSIEYFSDKYECVKDADLLVVLTEWGEFQELDFDKLEQNMKSKFIYDCRNIVKSIRSDFKVCKVGKNNEII